MRNEQHIADYYAALEQTPRREQPLLYLPWQSGLHQLSADLTINGQTVSPTFRYSAADATLTDWAGEYGNTLAIAGTTAPTLAAGSPLLGESDTSVKFAGTAAGKYYEAASADTYNIGTEDVVWEFVIRPNTSSLAAASEQVTGKGFWNNVGYPGWLFAITNAGAISFGIESASVRTWGTVGTITPGAWTHLVVMLDRDSTTGFRAYANGVLINTPGNLSATYETLTNSVKFRLGHSVYPAGNAFSGNLAHAAMYLLSDIGTDADEKLALAAQRFYALTGVKAARAKGSAYPETCTRTTTAYLDKVEADGTRKGYLVGPNWPRVVKRKDQWGATIQGYLAECQSTNVMQDTTTWAGAAASGCTFTAYGSELSPCGNTPYVITEDAATSAHGLTSVGAAAGAASEKVCTSFFAKRLNGYTRNIFTQAGNAPATGGDNCIWDLDAGTVTLGNGAIDGGIEDWGNGWYRCWYSWQYSATGGGHLPIMYLYVGGASFEGANTETMLFADYQEEHYLNSDPVYGYLYPTSYVATTSTADVTRTTDTLRYNATGLIDGQKGRCSFSVLQPDVDFQDSHTTYVSASDALTGTTERLDFGYHVGGADVARFQALDGGATTATCNTASDLFNGTVTPLEFAWRATGIKVTVSGTVEAQDTSITGGGMPDALRYLAVGHIAISTPASYRACAPIGPLTIYKRYR